MTYLVIDVGGTFTKYAIMDASGNFIDKGKITTVKEGSSAFVSSLYNLYLNYPNIDGIAIASAGVIDSDRGVMYNGGSLDFIKNLPIVDLLSECCQVPVTIENDAKCAALAELWKGSFSDCQNAIAMIIGTAVGGAIIIDRKIVKGKNLLAGEFSYILTDSSDSLNWRKNFAINGGLPALIETCAKQKKLVAKQVTGELIFKWAKEGDENTLACLRDYAHLLATQIVNLHFVINPDRIAIGGGVSEQPLLLELINEEVGRLIENYPFSVAKPEIVSCQFHNDANLIGALFHYQKSKGNYNNDEARK